MLATVKLLSRSWFWFIFFVSKRGAVPSSDSGSSNGRSTSKLRHDLTHSLNMYKLLIASVLMAGAMAAPEADADSYYGGFSPGVAGHPTGTSFVARSPQGLGKRSAD